MTPTEFTALAARTRLRPRAIALARAVLVDSLTPTQAAQAVGADRQEAHRAAARIRAELARDGVCPACGRALTENHA